MIYIASDHRGYNLKEYLKDYMSKAKIPFKDVGNHKFDPEDDYPDFALKIANKVAENLDENLGVMICGSGLGMVVVANKVMDIRAGLATNEWLAQHARENDDLNIISLAADLTDFSLSEKILKTWLGSKFKDEPKYRRRLEKIAKIEALWK